MPFRVPVERLHLLPNIPAGMCPSTLLGLVPLLRKTGEDHPPILVREDGDGWQILDGRHRFFASVIAGRPDVLAEVEHAEAAGP
jgi:hypothetical protein